MFEQKRAYWRSLDNAAKLFSAASSPKDTRVFRFYCELKEEVEENALLEWKQIYKMVSTKHNVLIYSSRVNAYILPMEIVGGQYAALKELADKNLKKHQNCMKKR